MDRAKQTAAPSEVEKRANPQMKTRQLFLMGNKRSGSTLMVNLLNLHPNVFVTHESDIVWLLYQASRGLLAEEKCHPLDAPRGMQSTLDACRSILEARLPEGAETGAIADTLLRVQTYIMRHGSAMDKPKPDKGNLAWIGDKKPTQHCDPELRTFLTAHFPEARYIHLVRHPRHVVASIQKAAKTWKVVPNWWKQSPRDILEEWTVREEWVLAAKTEPGTLIHTMRMEDLCRRPVEEMAASLAFLELEMPEPTPARIQQLVDPHASRRYDSFSVPVSPRAARIMELYGYG